MIKYIILSAVIGGLLNRLRGGQAVDFLISKGIIETEDDLLGKVAKSTVKISMALFTTLCLYLPLWYSSINFEFYLNDYLWMVGVWLAAYGLGQAPGWGSWFEIGRNPHSYRHNKDWIISELVAKWIYGDKTDARKANFKWRRDRELLAMNVRGLNFTIFAPLMFGLHMHFEYGLTLCYLVLIFPVGFIMGHLYEIGYKMNLIKFPSWAKGNTHIGELLTGATLMSSVLMIGSWIALIYI